MDVIRIKVLGANACCGESPFLFNNRYLFIFDAACRTYDWLWVNDELPKYDVGSYADGREPLACSRAQTILSTQEPVSVKFYGHAYTNQFGYLLTNRPASADHHPGYVLGRGYMVWYYGKSYAQACSEAPIEKIKLLSTVCSSKRHSLHTQHDARYQLTTYLSEHLPALEWFGHGVKGFDNKSDVLDPYRYHIAVENHLAPHHWTEKLTDSILGRCLTFYAGAPDYADDLPADAVIPIPLNDHSRTLQIIRDAIASGEYEKRLPAIEEARKLILERFNPWAQIAHVIDLANASSAVSRRDMSPAFISSRHRLRRNPLVALADAWSHVTRLR